MTSTSAQPIKQQTPDDLKRIAEISSTIRHAIRTAFPTPPEQFLTVMTPAKDYNAGFDQNGQLTSPTPPISIQLNEAVLCDDMPTLSGVQLGPTGKSVARSYSTALSKLVPTVTTFGTDKDQRNKAEKQYDEAMEWFVTEDPRHSGGTRIQLYLEKQNAYTDAVERKTKAFNDALDKATSDTTMRTLDQKRAAYDKWVADNGRAYRDQVQAAYMDWVLVGKKEEAEYWFTIVDKASTMSRIEASKESMRAATVSDTDGAVEYNTVHLNPSNWAWIAMKKAEEAMNPVVDKNGRTIQWYISEIARLQNMGTILQALDNISFEDISPNKNAGRNEFALTVFLDEYRALVKDPEAALQRVRDAWSDLATTRRALADAFARHAKEGEITRLSSEVKQAQDKLLSEIDVPQEINNNAVKIKVYTTALAELEARPLAVRSATMGVPSNNFLDYWDSVSAVVPSNGQGDNNYSEGGSGAWGTWSAGGYFSQSSTSIKNATEQLYKTKATVSFECMRVDITRSWLRPELFRDDDLKLSPGTSISPGPAMLGWLMDFNLYSAPLKPGTNNAYSEADRKVLLSQLDDYVFPMYPTAFLLAANVVLELEGDATAIQQHFQGATSSLSSLGYGPFTINVGHSTDSLGSATFEATDSGCRITIKSPQIIGWISEMVPALPRLQPSVSDVVI